MTPALSGLPVYRQKHLLSGNTDLFGNTDWQYYSGGYLSNRKIKAVYEAGHEIGYFSTSITSVAAVDIDDHLKTGTLPEKYRQVWTALHKPSIVYSSPRGLHCYWHLQETLPAAVVEMLLQRRVAKYADIRPTMKSGLRLPVQERLLDVETLQPCSPYEIRVLSPAALFDADYLPDQLRETLHTGNWITCTAHLAKLEARFLPAMGNTNTPLVQLAYAYRKAGLTPDQAADRFTLLLESVAYTGELTNRRRLLQRINSLYSKSANLLTLASTERQLTFDDSLILQAVIEKAPFQAKQGKRRGSLQRICEKILDWRGYVQAVYDSPRDCAVWNYLYPYFRHNMRRGYVPLPRSVLLQANDRYNEYLPALLETGLLMPAPFGHSDKLGVCKHYAVAGSVQELSIYSNANSKLSRNADTY